MLTIVSFNIWGIYGPNLSERWAYAAECIKKLKVDILCLQEATDTQLLEKLSQTVDLPIIQSDVDQTGLAILSHLKPNHFSLVQYPIQSPLENYYRKFIWCEIEYQTQKILVTNTHLSWKPKDDNTRKQQAEVLGNFVLELNLPTILCGDFNCKFDSLPMQALRDMNILDSMQSFPDKNRASWDNSNPFIQGHSVKFSDRRIDLILTTNNLTTQHCQIVLNQPNSEGLHPSDHFGVLAKIKMRN